MYNYQIFFSSDETFEPFFSDTATKDQDLTESVVEELHHDITSPVRSFLEKSKQQVEKYWKSMLNDVDEEEEAAEEKQRHLGTIHILHKHLYKTHSFWGRSMYILPLS